MDHEIEDCTQNTSDTEAAQILSQLAYGLDAIYEEGSLSLLVQRIVSRLQDRY